MKAHGFVLLNPRAHGGRGRARFDRVRGEIERRFDIDEVELDTAGAWRNRLSKAIADGSRIVIAAGGDGTVHALVNALDAVHGDVALGSFVIGAVGLGSSNDFHKPYRNVVDGIPLCVDVDSKQPRDLVEVHFSDEESAWQRRLFVVSASFGLTADGNAFFNEGDALLHWMRKRWTGAAIVYSAVHTIAVYHPIAAELRVEGTRRATTTLTNLSVMKTPYLSGQFRYDTPIDPASGSFAVNLCEARGRVRRMVALVDLGRGRFLGRPGMHHWDAHELEVELDRTHDLELDGEILRARRARFEIAPERILTCAR